MKRILTLGTAGMTAILSTHAATVIWAPDENPMVELLGLPLDYQWDNRWNWQGKSYSAVPGSDDNVLIPDAPPATPVLVDAAAAYYILEIAPNAGDIAHVWLMPGGSMANSGAPNEQYVGRRGYGVISQTGGSYASGRRTVLGDEPGSTGVYNLAGGTNVMGWGAVIGNAGHGQVTVSGGSFNAGQEGGNSPVAGNAPTGSGKIDIHGGEFKAEGTCDFTLGNQGWADMTVHGGTVSIPRNFMVGFTNQAHASTLDVLGGDFAAGWDLRVGVHGWGAFTAASPATVTNVYFRRLYVGECAGGRGRVELGGAYIPMDKYNEGAFVFVGQAGRGELLLKGAHFKAAGTGGMVVVREHEEGFGVIRGYGLFDTFQNRVVNNGLVIADGFGADHELSFTMDRTEFYVTNTIPNTSTNGWYARDGGKLNLPWIRLANSGAPMDYVWGAGVNDPGLTLVNSLRVTVGRNENNNVNMHVSLLSPDRAEVPPLPRADAVAGVWRVWFATSGVVDDCGVEIRYDHVATKNSPPLLYQYNPLADEWTRLETTALPGHCVKAVNLPVFVEGSTPTLGYIAAFKYPAANLFYLK